MINRKFLKRIGYVTDQKGIINRYIEEQENWSSHLNNSRQTVLDFCSRVDTEKLTIFGSGWLLDLPVYDLIPRFRKIELIDVYHPRQIRKKLGKFDNVEFTCTDLTGNGIEVVGNWLKKAGSVESIEGIEIFPYSPPDKSGSFVSLNLLNQLDNILLDPIQNKLNLGSEFLIPLRAKIQKAHLDLLQTLKSCLITDVNEKIYGKKGLEETRDLVFVAIPKGVNQKSWNWIFDTRGAYYPGKRVEFSVQANMYNI
ncbi:MAG: hypothetical protein ACOCYF_00830 [Bacteroidota bacterium]